MLSTFIIAAHKMLTFTPMNLVSRGKPFVIVVKNNETKTNYIDIMT